MKIYAGVVLICAVFLLFQSPVCYAGKPTEKVRDILEQVMVVQTDPQFRGSQFRDKRRAAIHQIIARTFHFESMAKKALGERWEKLHAFQREEFRSLFQELFQDSYTRLVLDFLGREKIVYGQEEARAEDAVVKTRIMRTNEEIPVDYSLTEVEATWLIQDVLIDGMSIVQNYQKAFARVMKQESYEALLRKMKLQKEAAGKN
jgi:phospholipid transport system substrate-binding protein